MKAYSYLLSYIWELEKQTKQSNLVQRMSYYLTKKDWFVNAQVLTKTMLFENSEFISLILVPVFKTTHLPALYLTAVLENTRTTATFMTSVKIKYIHLKWAIWGPWQQRITLGAVQKIIHPCILCEYWSTYDLMANVLIYIRFDPYNTFWPSWYTMQLAM